MEMMLGLVKQVLTMFLLVGVGYLMYNSGKITKEGSKSLGNILIYISLPCVITNSFLVEKTTEKMLGLLYSSCVALVILFISIFVAKIFFPKNAIAAFAGAFSNPGFFGVPIIVACFSEGAVFYVASFIAFLNLLQWTYGVSILLKESGQVSDGKLITPKKVLTAPFMVAILIGLFFFITGFSMPTIIKNCVSVMAGLNTPIAMLSVGIYLAQTDIKLMIKKTSMYLVSAVRLIIIPALAIVVLTLVPDTYYEMKMVILIAAACPVGSNVAVYAQLHDKDYPYAVETVIISTLFSLVTIPVIVGFANFIWEII